MSGFRHAQRESGPSATGLASWYVPGHADGFGDRLLMFDNTSTPSLELLRFRPELAATPGFEEALRERIRDLRGFRHSSFASIRAVQHLDGGEGLALVSEHAAGQRLSEIFEQQPRHRVNPGIVTWILRELTASLAAFQAQGGAVAHGALTPDRILLTPDGGLCVVEHVLGSALATLELSPAALWRGFGIVAPANDHGTSRIEPGTDVAQLAGVALSMLLARRVTLQDLQQRLPVLLDEFSELTTTVSSHQVSPLRTWIERALRTDGTGYRSASDAQYDVRQLPTHREGQHSTAIAVPHVPMTPPTIDALRQMSTGDGAQSTQPPRDLPPPVPQRPVEPEELFQDFPSEFAPEPPPSAHVTSPAAKSPPSLVITPFPAPSSEPVPHRAPSPGPRLMPERSMLLPAFASSSAGAAAAAARNPSRAGRLWLIAAMGLAIVGQSVLIAYLLGRGPAPPTGFVIESGRPGDTVVINGEKAGVTPLAVEGGTSIQSLRVMAAGVAPSALATAGTAEVSPPPAGRPPDAAAPLAAPRPRPSAVRFRSAIALNIFERDEVLGSTSDGPIVVPAGTHTFQLVNASLGYSGTATVTVKPGESLTIAHALPDGTVSVNAQPWADVEIGGKSYGETPLANLKVPIGQHEIVFRNPKLGERRQTIVVRADEVTRVSVRFDQ